MAAGDPSLWMHCAHHLELGEEVHPHLHDGIQGPRTQFTYNSIRVSKLQIKKPLAWLAFSSPLLFQKTILAVISKTGSAVESFAWLYGNFDTYKTFFYAVTSMFIRVLVTHLLNRGTGYTCPLFKYPSSSLANRSQGYALREDNVCFTLMWRNVYLPFWCHDLGVHITEEIISIDGKITPYWVSTVITVARVPTGSFVLMGTSWYQWMGSLIR